MRISYSSLELYENCPKRFEFQEIQKIKVPKSKEQFFGTKIHDALKFFHNPAPLLPTIEELKNFFINSWQPENIEWKSQEEKNVCREEGLKILEQYYLKNSQQKYNIVDLETFMEAPIENHILTGKIDRIDKLSDGEFEIIDYKTNRKMPSQEKVAQNLQLAVYAMGFLARWPNFKDKKIKLSLYFLRHNEKISTEKNNDLLEETKRKILKIIALIEKKYFPPLPGALCDWCGYRKICPMWKNLYEDKKIPSEEELKVLIKEYFELKDVSDETDRCLAHIKKSINDYCESRGVERVFGDEGYISRAIQVRANYDFEKIREILEPLGYWQKILAVDKKKFDVLLKKIEPILAQKIEAEARLEDKSFKVFKAVKSQMLTNLTTNDTNNS